MQKHDDLRLSNQICFPLYAASKEVIRRYRPFLDPLDLTYTQYITMMVMWEEKEINVKSLGAKLFLDSGTLTPVLKSLEAKGYVRRGRSPEDNRVLTVTLTEEGAELKEACREIPSCIASKCSALSQEEALQLYGLLYKLLGGFAPE